MKYRIEFQKAALKFIRKQDKPTQERLLTAINKLPSGTDIKKLQGHNMFRMRVGDMRVLYTIDDIIMVISIENIDSRGGIFVAHLRRLFMFVHCHILCHIFVTFYGT